MPGSKGVPSGSGPQLNKADAEKLWDDVADAVDTTTLSALAMGDRRRQVAPAVAKALVGVFAARVFTSLGVDDLGRRAAERALYVLHHLRAGTASEMNPDELRASEAESWVALIRESAVPEEVAAYAEAAVTQLLIQVAGEDSAHARASAKGLARAILGS
jgi:hypothetical protein